MASSSASWYRQPVLWLGILVFVLFLAASVFTIALAARVADEPLAEGAERVLKMPASRVVGRDRDEPNEAR